MTGLGQANRFIERLWLDQVKDTAALKLNWKSLLGA